jgi:hypothetical protein
MSERISWENCPTCGSPAAVGWTTVLWVAGESREEGPIEFDCPSGCHLSHQALAEAFGQRA